MALVVEDGTGKSDADSYLSVADATAYFVATDTKDAERHDLIAAWAEDQNDSKREAALREATAYLDGRYLERWVGSKASSAQALAWPRTGAYDAHGYAIASTTIPSKLKHATAELALRAIASTVVPDIAANTGTLTAKTVTAGAVTLSQQWASGTVSQRAKLERVDLLLRPLMNGAGGGVVSLMRA